MEIVVDASVFISIILNEPEKQKNHCSDGRCGNYRSRYHFVCNLQRIYQNVQEEKIKRKTNTTKFLVI